MTERHTDMTKQRVALRNFEKGLHKPVSSSQKNSSYEVKNYSSSYNFVTAGRVEYHAYYHIPNMQIQLAKRS